MASSWQLRYNDGTNWASWFDIPNPENDITVTQTSTRTKHVLYNGAIGRTVPNTKFNYEEVSLNWSYISGTSVLISDTVIASSLSVATIVSAGYKVEFKTHNLESTTTQTWQGYFMSYPRTYKVGMYPVSLGVFETFYDLVVEFDLIDVT
jgi:hypothetical protein